MDMQINAEEKGMLKKALNHYLRELSGEISGTDNADFKQNLKHEREVLSVLNQRLGGE